MPNIRINYMYKISKLALLFILFYTPCCVAQDIVVKSVELSLRDASASTNPRVDGDGMSCALLKVVAVNKHIQFGGDVVGTVENKTNEYWVYMKRGSQKVTISAPSFSTMTISFKDYDIESLQSKATYNIVLYFPNQSNVAELKNSRTQNLSYSECKVAAESGSPSALVDLGKCYLYGLGTMENPNAAARCFDKAAQQGYAEAMHLMGDSFFNGIGNPKNYEIAFDYYSKAAKMDYTPSIYSLGLCYEQGKGVKKNPKKAIKCFKDAANKGHIKAANKIKR